MTALIKKFPVYVIRVGGGYATLSTPHSPEDAPEFAVLVFSEETLASEFIDATQLQDAEVRFIRDERELARVLVPQRDPVTHVAIDARLEQGGHLTLTCIPIPEMLHKHLLKARSPWDYPVFLLQMADGQFAAIRAARGENASKTIHAVALFTTNQRAKMYRQGMKSASGVTIFPVPAPIRLRDILRDIATAGVNAVALDPVITEEGVHQTPQCLAVDKFLATFLM